MCVWNSTQTCTSGPCWEKTTRRSTEPQWTCGALASPSTTRPRAACRSDLSKDLGGTRKLCKTSDTLKVHKLFGLLKKKEAISHVPRDITQPGARRADCSKSGFPLCVWTLSAFRVSSCSYIRSVVNNVQPSCLEDIIYIYFPDFNFPFNIKKIYVIIQKNLLQERKKKKTMNNEHSYHFSLKESTWE